MAQSTYDAALSMASPTYSDKSSPTERQPIVRSRANITSACLACKRRKRKCLGGSPCPHCASLRIQCSYDERLDKRRKAFNEKARAEIDFQRRLLDGLLKAIKSEHAPTILDMVRGNASLEELAGKLEYLDMLSEIPIDPSQYVRRPSHELETPVGQAQQNHMAIMRAEGDGSHALSINQLLAPRPQHQQQSQPQSLPPPPLNSSVSIPSLSEVLLEAQRHRMHDEETSHVKPSVCFSQEQLPVPRLIPFSARIDMRPPGPAQPLLLSRVPQDCTPVMTSAHSPIHQSDPRLAMSATR